MLFEFYSVDPLAGEFPPVTETEAGKIPQRMRRLLRNRSLGELEHYLAVVNFVLDNMGQKLASRALKYEANKENSARSDETDTPADDTPFVGYDDDAGLLFACVNEVDLSPFQTPFPVLWHELFAVLALALLNIAADEELHYDRWDDSDSGLHDWRVLWHVADWTRQAERAASLAEALALGWQQELDRQSGVQTFKEYKAKESVQKKAAALIRHKPTTKAALELTRYYRAGTFRSIRDATSRFCREYPELVKHLSEDNRVRTLSAKLSKQLKDLGHE